MAAQRPGLHSNRAGAGMQTSPDTVATTSTEVEFRPSGRRWIIVGLLFLAAVLNYIDRNVLSILAPTIQKELGVSDAQYAHVLSAFLAAYTVAYLFSGRIVDWLGSRLSMALFLGWWSVSNALTGLARGPVSLGAFRALLGLGEAGGWTASPKAVQEWFPPAERGMAVGIYSMGSSIGATVAPLVVIPLAVAWGWQWAFVVTGSMGILWLGPWLWLNRRPTYAVAEPVPRAEKEAEWALWKSVLRQPAVWMFMLARLFTDAVWYFYLFWMPKYLHEARGLTQDDLKVLWVIFLAADIGFVGGGFLSGRLIKRKVPVAAARLWLMLATALITPLSPLVALAPGAGLAIALAALIALAHASWLSNLSALIVDIIPKRIMATTFGVIAAGSAVGGMAMNEVVSWMVRDFSYTPCFFIMAFMHPIGIILLWRLRRQPAQA